MAHGVALTPSPGVVVPSVQTPGRPLTLGSAVFQVGQVVKAQPAYIGAYGGSFCSPTGLRSGSSVVASSSYAGTPVAPAAPLRRRLNSQQSSTASLMVQQPVMASASNMVVAAPPVRGLPSAYNAAIIASQGDSVSCRAAQPAVQAPGAAIVEVVPAQEVLRQGDDADNARLQAEVESLRRSVAVQEDRILQLTNQLQASQENERVLASDLEASRGDDTRLWTVTEELRLERLAREQAEAIATELRLVAEMAVQGQVVSAPAAVGSSGVTSNTVRASTPGRGGLSGNFSPGRRAPNTSARGKEALAERQGLGTQSNPGSSARGTVGLASGRRGSMSAKDEIDGRLHEFLERFNCGLTFRRLNRGWYSFRCNGDRADRSAEISIVNGKLMARLEPSTHDPGWNNGKLGNLERFVTAMTAQS